MKKEIIITPSELKGKLTLQKTICLDKYKPKIIKGSLFDNECRPIKDSIIKVLKKEYTTRGYEISEVGYVITDEKGNFVIVIEESKYVDYELRVYEPIVQC